MTYDPNGGSGEKTTAKIQPCRGCFFRPFRPIASHPIPSGRIPSRPVSPHYFASRPMPWVSWIFCFVPTLIRSIPVVAVCFCFFRFLSPTSLPSFLLYFVAVIYPDPALCTYNRALCHYLRTFPIVSDDPPELSHNGVGGATYVPIYCTTVR